MCDYKVPCPMQRPCYRFEEAPSVSQLRQRAMDAMEDLLSIQWFTPKKIVHGKTGAVGGKRFIYDANVIFAGLPYTNGDRGLFQFMEYYNQQTGELMFPGTPEEFNTLLGCTCAGGVMWGWSAVCHTLNGTFVNYNMTPKWGCYPVGSYHIPEDIDTYENHSTLRIIEENGVPAILEAYCAIQPGDAVTSSPYNHTMMCIEVPHVVRKADGSINLEESYVMIRDQRGGFKAGFYDKREEDDLLHFSGRISFQYPFARLLAESYIPVAPAELLGREPYEASWVTCQDGILSSNFPMAVVKALDADGKTQKLYAFTKRDVLSGFARHYPLDQLDAGSSTLLEVITTDGTVHSFPI